MSQPATTAEEVRKHLGDDFKFPWEEGAKPYTPSIVPSILKDTPILQQEEPITDILQRFCPFQGSIAFIMGRFAAE